MTSSWGLVIAFVIIIVGASGGFWYWNKIRERKSEEPSRKTDRPLVQEPILVPDKPKISQTPDIVVRPEEDQPEEPIKENVELPESTSEESEPQDLPEEPLSYPVTAETEETEGTKLPPYDPFLKELVEVRLRKPATGSQIEPFVKLAYEIAPNGLLRVLALESNSKRWFKPDVLGMFESVAFCFQLSSSRATFTEVSLSSLISQVFQRMEMNLDGSAEMKEMSELVHKTNRLNEMVKQFGVQITLLLRPLDRVSIDKFEREAEELGFKRRNAKHYERIGELVLDKKGKRIGNRKGTIELRWLDDKNITISLNVPLIAPEEQPLRLLLQSANAFAAVFEAKIVGSNGREIGSPTISLLSQELDRFYKEMRSKDLEPGSERAHLLLD